MAAKMKRALILLFITAALVPAQTKELSLDESLKIGLGNSKALKISKSKVIGAEAKVKEFSSQLFPKLSLSANYTRLSEVPPFEVNVPLSPVPIRIQDAILNNYGIKLSLQQPLFTGFRLSSLKSAAELNKEALDIEFTKEENETALNIQNAFWNYYKARQVVKLIGENLKSLEDHLRDTKSFLANGLATKNDLLKLEVQYSNVRLLKLESENNLKIARAAFNKALGFNLAAQTEIITKEIEANLIQYNYDELLSEALSKREELKALQFRISASEENVSATNSGLYPSVYLTAGYNYSRPNQRILPAKDEFKDTWDVSVVLNWDLWNWGYTASQTTQAEQQLIQNQTAYESLKENVELDVYQSYLRVISEFDKVDLNKKTVEQAGENYRILKEKYNEQLATSTDLIDAEVSLLDAQTKLTNALVDFQLAKVKLEKAVGRKIYWK